MNPISKVLKIKQIINDPFGDYPTLSIKERLVGKLSVMGYTLNEIAEMTDYSLGSVNVYSSKVSAVVGCSKEQLGAFILKKIKTIVEANGD